LEVWGWGFRGLEEWKRGRGVEERKRSGRGVEVWKRGRGVEEE